MERYVTGGAIGVYEKGGAEEMEPGEAPAVRALILVWGHHEVRCFLGVAFFRNCGHNRNSRDMEVSRRHSLPRFDCEIEGSAYIHQLAARPEG